MRYLMLLSLLFLPGCSLTKGTMLDGSICTFQSDDAAKAAMYDLIDSLEEGPDKVKAKHYAALAGVSATVLCETRRAIEAQQAAK